MRFVLGFGGALLAMLGLVGCGGDDATCVKRLCDPATFGAVCVGHAVQSCAADGEAFVYTACSSQQRCQASGASAQCVARTCTTLDEATCANVTDRERCNADGSAVERLPCGSGEVCKDGACVAPTCSGEPDVCTTNGVLTCQQAAWVQTNCAPGELCSVGDNGVARCRPAACTPEARRCDGDTAMVCDARGIAETPAPCERGEVCIAGVCQQAVCGGGGGGGDTSDGDVEVVDTSEVDAPEPESTIVFTLDGVASTFDISATALYDAGKRTITAVASKGNKKLELRFAPTTVPTLTGAFDSAVFNPVKVVLCYDSGGTAGALASCEGYTHESVAYQVTITRADGPGGRFEGTFEATLEDENTVAIELLAGQFNVRYR